MKNRNESKGIKRSDKWISDETNVSHSIDRMFDEDEGDVQLRGEVENDKSEIA